MTRRIVYIDLDGTLVEPSPGIFASIRHACTALDKPCPPETELPKWIGPPLGASFAAHLGEEYADTAVAAYREYYGATGWHECSLYPGIDDALTALSSAGYDLVVATSKPGVYAMRIIRHFGLDDRFLDVCGSKLDGRLSHKDDLLSHLQQRYDFRGVTMVGDRRFDIEGAHANGIAALAAAWGFGTREELVQAGAHAILNTPAQIPEAVRML